MRLKIGTRINQETKSFLIPKNPGLVFRPPILRVETNLRNKLRTWTPREDNLDEIQWSIWVKRLEITVILDPIPFEDTDPRRYNVFTTVTPRDVSIEPVLVMRKGSKKFCLRGLKYSTKTLLSSTDETRRVTSWKEEVKGELSHRNSRVVSILNKANMRKYRELVQTSHLNDGGKDDEEHFTGIKYSSPIRTRGERTKSIFVLVTPTLNYFTNGPSRNPTSKINPKRLLQVRLLHKIHEGGHNEKKNLGNIRPILPRKIKESKMVKSHRRVKIGKKGTGIRMRKSSEQVWILLAKKPLPRHVP